MADRRIAREQVLAFRQARHHLDQHRPLHELDSVVGACGIQATPPGNADVALAARLDIDAPIAAAAIDTKKLVATWSIRGAPHLLPLQDAAVFTLGARPSEETITSQWRQPAGALETVEKATIAALKRSPRPKGDVSGAVATAEPDLSPHCRACDARHPYDSLFRAAPLLGRIVLTSTAPVLMARAKSWLGADFTGDAETLRIKLLLRYLHCYSPTTPAHFAGWAGISGAEAKARWTAVADALVPVSAGKRAFVLEEDLDALEHAGPASGVRLLPSKDVYLQARDRELLLPEKAHRSAVFTALGGPGLVLVDADPVATWRGAAKGKAYDVTVTAWRKIAPSVRSAVEEEAQRVARVRGHELARVKFA